ncbi:Amino acid transporter AVT1C [Linum perenne]
MKNSASDQSFYIDSDEEEERDFNPDEEGDDDSDESMPDNQNQSKPGSYITSWPQSYRQSIDLYSSVPSPGINFLNTPSLTRLGSSFLTSSLVRRHTPESLPTATAPLLQKQPPHKKSSQALLPPIPRRRSSIRKDDKASSMIGHELPISRQSSFGQAVINGLNVLCGVGILSTPYAAKEGGWAGLSILIIFGVLSFYTGLLLRSCLDSEPGLETYPDIGHAAFGTPGRIAISIILYVELYACCVEYIILESDNLSSLFPNAHLSLFGMYLDAHHLFALMTTLAVLPTVWLRDLRVLSYISVYMGVAVMGYTMFGDATASQFTLNMPTDLVATKIAVWTTVVNPFTKYALTMMPVALCLEELIPQNMNKSYMYGMGIRTLLVISTLVVGLSVPFFGKLVVTFSSDPALSALVMLTSTDKLNLVICSGLVMSLIGSLLTMFVVSIISS